MSRWLFQLLFWLGVLMAGGAVQAHESRPAYLEINEVGPSRYSLLWRTPVNAGMRLPVRLELPDCSRDLSSPVVRDLSDSRVERRSIECPEGLAGKRIHFAGLPATITDVLVRIQLTNGTEVSVLVRPSNASVEIPSRQGSFSVAKAYGALGIEHILGGFDHLLFVAALVMLVTNIRMLVWTVTSFTVAHSITLALVTMQLINVPGPPVEAFIALSIIFVALEIVQRERGRPSLASQKPWVVAFAFGLLHGLGFAGALAEIGLPQDNIPLALLFFNVGVEVGQLIFVAALVLLIAAARRAASQGQRRAGVLASSYLIGGVASYWLIERITAFL